MMKVLSLTEPYATLIANGQKCIETRSWKTKYRGELYIHASATKIPESTLENEKLMDLIKNKPLNYGHIICKCNLVDCIYMTEEYVHEMKEKNPQEYLCGEYKVGRYAWVLDDVIPLENKMKAKGQLNIWNFYQDFEIMELMENIEYGWIDLQNQRYNFVNERFSQEYFLQSPKETRKNKIGICWDQVELERYYFKSNPWNIKTYFIVHYDSDKCPTHTFLTYEKDNKYYWFEHSWEQFRGIHEYDSESDLLLDVRNKFIKYELNNQYINENLKLYEYKKPKYHISVQEFYNHCKNGKYIDFNNL